MKKARRCRTCKGELDSLKADGLGAAAQSEQAASDICWVCRRLYRSVQHEAVDLEKEMKAFEDIIPFS
jgi:uncharacterized protein with PIN domain